MAYIMVALSSFVIGFSGALMPGPLLGMTIDIGLKKGFKGGILIAIGHAMLDLITLVLLMLGLKEFMTNTVVSAIIGIVGGSVLVHMGITMFLHAHRDEVSLESVNGKVDSNKWYRLIIKGMTVSISNPYYIIWWASVGLALVLNASNFGLLGIALVYLGHIASDIVWLVFVAYTMHKSQKIMSHKVYKNIILSIGSFIACFGIYFIIIGIGFL